MQKILQFNITPYSRAVLDDTKLVEINSVNYYSLVIGKLNYYVTEATNIVINQNCAKYYQLTKECANHFKLLGYMGYDLLFGANILPETTINTNELFVTFVNANPTECGKTYALAHYGNEYLLYDQNCTSSLNISPITLFNSLSQNIRLETAQQCKIFVIPPTFNSGLQKLNLMQMLVQNLTQVTSSMFNSTVSTFVDYVTEKKQVEDFDNEDDNTVVLYAGIATIIMGVVGAATYGIYRWWNNNKLQKLAKEHNSQEIAPDEDSGWYMSPLVFQTNIIRDNNLKKDTVIQDSHGNTICNNINIEELIRHTGYYNIPSNKPVEGYYMEIVGESVALSYMDA